MNAGAGAVDAGFGCAAATAALRCEFPIITSYRVLSSDHTLREFLASVLLRGHPRQNKDGPCRYMTGGSGMTNSSSAATITIAKKSTATPSAEPSSSSIRYKVDVTGMATKSKIMVADTH